MNSQSQSFNPIKMNDEAILAFILAVAAATLIKLPTLFGIHLDHDESFYFRNMSFFVLPLLTAYDYLPVYAIWALIVVIIFPPLFGFI